MKTKSWVLLVCAAVLIIMSRTALSHTAHDNQEDNNDCSAKNLLCPKVHNHSTGSLHFVDNYPKQPMVQIAQTCFFISCCTSDQPNVNTTWYKWMPMTQHWCEQIKSETDCIIWEYRKVIDNGQKLNFLDSASDSDSGRYQCIATDGRTTINRTFDVQVVDCENNPANVTFSKPSNLQASLGSTFTQDCEGDFGCRGAVKEDNLAWFSYLDQQGHLKNLMVGKHGHYSVTVNTSKDETKKKALLTIEEVKKEDFGRTFLCQLKMGDKPTVGFNFSLTETGKIMAWQKFLPLIVVLSIVFAVSILTAVLMSTVCRPLVLFKWASAANKLPCRDPSHHKFDVMLITREGVEEGLKGDEEERKVLKTLKDMLLEKGYTLHPLLHGNRVTEIDDVEKCVSIIFIISTFSSQVDSCLQSFDRYFSVGAEAKTNMIFVLTHSMSAAEWGKLSEDYKKIYPHAPKLCTKVTWPGEKRQRSSLQHANFWCQIQRFLPKPQPGNTGTSDTADPSPEQALLTGDIPSYV